MAGKAKSCYLSVYNNSLKKTVFTKVFFKMSDLNDYVKAENVIEKYPSPTFIISKETY